MSSTQRATSRGRDTGSPKKKAGSWLREQRQKAGLSQMDLANKLGLEHSPSFPRSKTALVGFRPKVWETGHGHLVFGLHNLLAFCSVTTASSAIPCPVQGWKGMNVVFLDVARRKERAATLNT